MIFGIYLNKTKACINYNNSIIIFYSARENNDKGIIGLSKNTQKLSKLKTRLKYKFPTFIQYSSY